MIGQTVSHYRIIEKLGEGGMGEVYLAEDTSLGRKVAVKFLSSDKSSDPDSRQRFVHEARAQAMLSHPNIATFYEVGEENEKVFIVMEYIEGQPLSRLAAGEKISLTEILDIAIQVGEGLQAAHEKGITHRDIKPENVLVTAKRHAKITDFGLAKWKGATTLTQTGARMGTAFYMSPEQVEGKKVDHRTDIFSLGVILYELVCARKPFEGETDTAIFYDLINTHPQPLARYSREVPEELERVVLKCLAKRPEERYQSMADLVADLKRCKRGPDGGKKEAPKSDKKSLAVLYFENMSADPDSDYFSAGITEDIITDLSKIEGLRVASRNAVLPYKGKPVDISQLGRKLNVDSVLEGSVRRASNRLRITAQLIDTQEGFHLWAERYDRELKDVFDLQEEIAKKIAEALRIRLSEKEEKKIGQKYKGNLQAYDFYLKGRNHYYQYTKSDLQVAIQMFKKALEIDPNYALAYAGLADSYYQFIDKNYETDKLFLTKAEEAAQKALSIDPECAEAYKALGTIYYRLGKMNRARKLLSRALEIDPNYLPARNNLALTQMDLGNFERAEREFLFIFEKESTFPFTSFMLALLYLNWKKYDRAEEFARKVLEFGESSFYLSVGNHVLGLIRLYQKEAEKALPFFEKASETEPDRPRSLLGLAMAYAALGEKDRSRQKIEQALQTPPAHEWVFWLLISTYALLEEKEKVYEWIEKGMEESVLDWIALEGNPFLEELRKEAKFQQVLQELKSQVMNSE